MDRKRKLLAASEAPAAKKKHVSSAAHNSPEAILNHKNRELTQAVRRLRRSLASSEAAKQSAVSEHRSSLASLSCILRNWSALETGLLALQGRFGLDLPPAELDDQLFLDAREHLLGDASAVGAAPEVEDMEDDDEEGDDGDAVSTLDTKLRQRVAFSSQLLGGLLQHIAADAADRAELSNKLRESLISEDEAVAKVRNEDDRLQSLIGKIKENNASAEARARAADAKAALLQDKVTLLGKELRKALNDAEDSNIERDTATRRLAAMEERNAQLQAKGFSGSGAAALADAGSSGGSGTDVQVAQLQDKVQELQEIADGRLAELKANKEKKIQMATQLCDLQAIATAPPSDEAVSSSRLYQDLEARLNLADQLRAGAEKHAALCQRSEAEIRTQLAAAWEKVGEEDKTAAVRHEESVKEHAAQVDALEQLCNQLQQRLDLQKAEVVQLGEWKKRLEESEELYSASIRQQEVLQREITRLKEGPAELASRSLVEELRRQLKEARSSEQSSADTAGSEAVSCLRKQLEDTSAELSAAQAVVDGHKQESNELITEIESISSELNKKSMQHERLLRQQADKDKMNADLMQLQIKAQSDSRKVEDEIRGLSEKVEVEQRLRELAEQKSQSFQERCHTLATALQRAEEAGRLASEKLEITKLEVVKLNHALRAISNNESALRDVHSKLETSLKTVVAENHESSLNRQRSEEELTMTKKKLDRVKAKLSAVTSGGGSRSGSSDLAEQRAAVMEKALRCPVNQTMWKDCIILRCCHMFSRRALEDNLANRNRKCPTCKGSYSKDDLRTIYLYLDNSG